MCQCQPVNSRFIISHFAILLSIDYIFQTDLPFLMKVLAKLIYMHSWNFIKHVEKIFFVYALLEYYYMKLVNS